MRLWHYTFRELRRRPGRTLLTLVGIVVGVAAIVAIVMTTRATRRAYRDLFEALTGRASLEVVADGQGGFDPAVAAELAAVPGVKAAVPLVQAPAALVGKAGAVPVLALGIDPARDRATRAYALRDGQWLDDADGLVLEAGFARAQGLELGKPVRLLTARGFSSLPLVGLLEPQGAAAANGGAVAFLRLATAQTVFGLKDRINSVQLVLDDGAAPDRVEAAVRGGLPAGLTVQTPASRGAIVQDTLFSTEQALNTMSLIALVAGAFVILNTFLMNVGERQRQLALLRALGATRRQVTGLLLREAALLGFAGTVLGIGAGWGLAQVLRNAMERLMGVPLAALPLAWEPVLAALVVGPGMALASTWFPARAAGRRSPLEALLAKRAPAQRGFPLWPCYAGLALLVVCVVMTGGLLGGWFPRSLFPVLIAPNLALGMVGCVLALPLLLRPVTPAVTAVLRPLFGVEGRLAFRQLARHPLRTSLTVGVLFVGATVSLGLGNASLNSVHDIYHWFDQTIAADFLVRGSLPDSSFALTATLPESLAEELAGLRGVERVDKVSFVLGRARGPEGPARQAVVLARTFAPGRPPRLDVRDLDAEEVVGRLGRGEAVLGMALAQQLGVGVGDEFFLETGHGPEAVRVGAVAHEYTGGGLCLYLEWETAKRLLDVPGVHAFEITATPAAAGPLREYCDRHGLMLQTNADMRAVIDRMIDGVQGFLYVLMALVFVVASLGIVNTLTMNIREQTRELGVLRALGMRRGQVRKMVLAQALALSLSSILPGTAVGLLLAYLMNVTSYALVGHKPAFFVDVTFVGVCVLAALLVGVLAALLPARQAARVRVIEALQYE